MSDPNKKHLCPQCKTWYFWHPDTLCGICQAKNAPPPAPAPATAPDVKEQMRAEAVHKQWEYDMEDSQFQDRFVSGPSVGY